VEFGVMFFSSEPEHANDKYKMVLEVAKRADAAGFVAVWTPERHFHEFGGIFPNPAITSAALAMVTRRLQLRAGSVISPLHDVLRVAEEWSVVDNLSGGRAAAAFGSGWNPDDFVFYPERYETRQAHMYQQLEVIHKLWSGGTLSRPNAYGQLVEVRLYPRPIQARLPIWITSSGNVKTFESAGAKGANLLTHLIGQDLDTLAAKIRAYRNARTHAGLDAQGGIVSLMLHTFLGASIEHVRDVVRRPFREYLRSALSLEEKATSASEAARGRHSSERLDVASPQMEELLDLTFERYFERAALMGTVQSCQPWLSQLANIGVNEIACLVDFGVSTDEALASFQYVSELRAAVQPTKPPLTR
jgi:natural product biosynthesis luciferase-like monooxygenase protein